MTETRTFPMSDWTEQEAAWVADGWQFVRITTYRSEGRRMARVTLVPADNGGTE